MRRFIRSSFFILWAMLLLPGLAVSATPAYTQGLLWKIQPNQGQSNQSAASYLLGTIHVDDERVTKFPLALESVLQQVDSVTLEMQMDSATLAQASMAMFITEGPDLKERVGEALFTRAAQKMALRGVPEMMVLRMKPWAVSTALSLPIPTTGVFMDKRIHSIALEQGKKVIGLETAEEQIAVFDTLTEAEQIVLLKETLDNYAQVPHMLESMIKAYIQRDLAQLERLNQEYMPKGSEQLMQRFMRHLVDERNVRMVKRMQGQLKRGNSLIAVGALHLPGEHGILNLLAQQGYKISVVY